MVKLSIIIPYHNTLELTKKLLDELIKQLTDEVEVLLIIDDGCKEFEKYPIKVIHIESNGTASKPRNIGLDNATGKYIAFIDSDDMIKPNYIKTILNKIDTTNFDYCLFSWEATNHPTIGKVIIKDNPPHWNTCVWNCIYKKDLIGNNRFNESLKKAEDEDFNKRVRKGIKTNIEDVLYIYYCGRPESLSNDNIIKTQIAIFQSKFGDIGGIEKSLYEFFTALKDDYDIVFFYKEGNAKQLLRYKQLVRCIKYTNQKITCNKYICNSTYDNIADNVNSSDNYYAQIIHSDYEAMNWKYNKHHKTNVHIAVSEVAKKSILKQCPNVETKVIYNLLTKQETQRVLKLISPTRFSWEKGYERVITMAKRLKERNIPFIWQIFTNEPLKDNIEGLVRREVTFDIDSYIKDSDYLLQLSNCESWGYSTVQAFELGIPVIATDYPAIYEQGLINGINGYILNMDMSNLDEIIDKMYNNDLKGFKYKKLDNKQQWIDELGKIENQNSLYKAPNEVEVKSLKKIYYNQEKVDAIIGTTFFVEVGERLNYLIDNKYVEMI